MTALSELTGAESVNNPVAYILLIRLTELAEAYRNIENMKLTFRKSEILEG